jgi:hypothetical protein
VSAVEQELIRQRDEYKAKLEKAEATIARQAALLDEARTLLCWPCSYWMPGVPGLCKRRGGYLECGSGKLRHKICELPACVLSRLSERGEG